MSDIFVSYAREDRDRIAPLVAELEAAGFSLWWDSDISPGHSFSARIEEELDAASAVIVAWSEHSVGSNWVQAEATEGLDRGVLVPVLLDDVRVPLPFRRLQSATLQRYPKQPEQEQVEQLKAALGTLLSRAPSPAAQLSVAKPERPPARRALVLIGAFAAISVALGAWLWTENRESTPVAAPNQLFFEPVAGVENDASRALSSLVEEVALGMQRLPGLSVTLPDAQALPRGLSVQASANEDSISVRVVNASAQAAVLERRYDISDGFNEVQDRISADLAGLLGSPVPRRSYSNSSAYRDYLVSTSLLREVPTASLLTKAEAQLSELADQHPKFARAFAQLCSLKITMYRETTDTEHFEAAEKNCHRALTLDDQDNEVRLSLARLYLAAGRHERALDEIRRAGRELTNSSRVQRLLGGALEAAGDDAGALRAYLDAYRIEPNYWRNANSLGGYYFDRANYEAAARYYGLETDLVRNKVRSLNNLAGALFMSGDEPAAVAAWRASAEIEMTINTAMNLGSALFYQRDFAASARYYNAALVLAPEDHRIHGHLADTLLASGGESHGEHYQRAIELATQSLRIDPDDNDTIGDLATYYAALRDVESATSSLSRLPDKLDSINAVYDVLVAEHRLGNRERIPGLIRELVELGYPANLLERDANLDTPFR